MAAYPPTETVSYDLQRLDFIVLALGAALVASIIIYERFMR